MRRRPPIAASASATATAAVLALAVTSCGSSEMHESPGSHTTVVATLCAHVPALNRLTIQRTVTATHGKDPHFTFPAHVTVTGSAVWPVARVLCAPPIPSAPGTCATPPVDDHSCGGGSQVSPPRTSIWCPVPGIAITYHLTFASGRKEYPSINADTNTCPQPKLWASLGTAMRLPHPNITTFTGGIYL